MRKVSNDIESIDRVIVPRGLRGLWWHFIHRIIKRDIIDMKKRKNQIWKIDETPDLKKYIEEHGYFEDRCFGNSETNAPNWDSDFTTKANEVEK